MIMSFKVLTTKATLCMRLLSSHPSESLLVTTYTKNVANQLVTCEGFIPSQDSQLQFLEYL